MATLLLEESVAGAAEAGPDFFGLALGHRTDGLPGFLQLLELAGGGVPVGRFRQGFGLFAELELALVVLFAGLVLLFQDFLVLGVELAGHLLEALHQGGKAFFRNHADVLPGFLDFLHGLELVLPENFGVVQQVFGLLAEGFLVGKVLDPLSHALFDKGSAVLLDFFEQALETVLEFRKLGGRNGPDVFPLGGEVLELVQHFLAAFFLRKQFQFVEDGGSVVLVVPGLPLPHFLETFRGGLVFQPQLVVLEFLVAYDVFPFLEGGPELEAQFLEVFVFVEALDPLNDGLELFGILFEAFLGRGVEGRNLFAQLATERVVFLQFGVAAF